MDQEKLNLLARIVRENPLFTEYDSDHEWDLARELVNEGLVTAKFLLTGTARMTATQAGVEASGQASLTGHQELDK